MHGAIRVLVDHLVGAGSSGTRPPHSLSGRSGGGGGLLTTRHLSDFLRLCSISRSISRSMRASSASISISRWSVRGIARSLAVRGGMRFLARGERLTKLSSGTGLTIEDGIEAFLSYENLNNQ